MLLSELVRQSGLGSAGGGDPEVTAVEYDSRQCRPGTLFVAVPGFHVDGHGFAAAAVQAGAVAVVAERTPIPPLPAPPRAGGPPPVGGGGAAGGARAAGPPPPAPPPPGGGGGGAPRGGGK